MLISSRKKRIDPVQFMFIAAVSTPLAATSVSAGQCVASPSTGSLTSYSVTSAHPVLASRQLLTGGGPGAFVNTRVATVRGAENSAPAVLSTSAAIRRYADFPEATDPEGRAPVTDYAALRRGGLAWDVSDTDPGTALDADGTASVVR
jgi:hypothetical protein